MSQAYLVAPVQVYGATIEQAQNIEFEYPKLGEVYNELRRIFQAGGDFHGIWDRDGFTDEWHVWAVEMFKMHDTDIWLVTHRWRWVVWVRHKRCIPLAFR